MLIAPINQQNLVQQKITNGSLILEPHIIWLTTKKQFIHFEPLLLSENRIHLGDNITLPIYGQGKVEISMKNGNIICLTNILYFPNLHKNLFSVCDHDEQGGGIFIIKK